MAGRVLGVHAFAHSFGAQVGAPGPARHVNFDGIVERIYAGVAVAAQDDGLDVAGFQFVDGHQLGGDVHKFIQAERQLHAIDFRGVDQTLHVFTQAENGGALLGFVAADAFENRGAIADDVRENVEGGVVPVDVLAVVPDFLGLGDGHIRS